MSSPIPEPTVRTTRYEVSCLPLDDIDAPHFTIAVEWRGEGQWAVLRLGSCLGADGSWDYESRPSSREDDWKTTHRFDLDTALALAVEHAPKLTVNGHSVADVLARKAAR